jgi:excisionase family DNA binding protein
MTERLMLRPTEAGDAIGVSRSKIYELIASGQIPSIRVDGAVRVPVKALEQWIAAKLSEATTEAGPTR